MRIESPVYEASDQMHQEFGKYANNHAQDLVVAKQDHDRATCAVIDGAKNFIGQKTWPAARIAARRGLRQTDGADTEELNGGEIVSSLMQQCAEEHPEACGLGLIQIINEAISSEHLRLGLLQPSQCEAARRWTGYIGHVRIDEKAVTVTGVGDCFVAINGSIVSGREKEIDRLLSSIVDAAAIWLHRDRQAVYEALMPTLNRRQFDFQNRANRLVEPAVDAKKTREFHHWVVSQVSEKLGTGLEPAQNLCQPIFDGQSGSLWYAAIDGTEIPRGGITIQTFPRASVDMIMMWTDGFRPATSPRKISALHELEPVNSQYSERAAILIREVNRKSS